ncbi:MAG: sulfonate transport system substrate-binding protein [Chloroflexota bacterium]|nr:sulfonate transport system substrate-binding protein [Chloroflexota bacterium]
MKALGRTARPAVAAVAVLAVALLASACGSSGQSGGPVKLRLGYLANLTHAAALVGIDKGYFTEELGSSVDFSTQSFNAGPQEVEALFGGALDAGFFGPSPAVNAYVKSKGDLLRIVSGATSGGAALVVREGISGAADLRGKSVATPQLGNTQDVALRAWLAQNGLKTDTQGGGDVKITPTENATILQLFQQGKLDGAWVPEPWSTRLVAEAGGKVLVDEATLWPGGNFATTELVVSRQFLADHQDVVEKLIRATLKTTDFLTANPTEAKAATNRQIAVLTQKKLADATLDGAWTHLRFTVDPLPGTIKTSTQNAKDAGLVAKDADINGLLDLRLLNKVLREANKPAVDAGGIGQA